MRKVIRQAGIFFLAVILTVGAFAPVTAQAKVTGYTESINTYLNGKKQTGYGWIEVYLGKSDTIKKSSVKTADSKVAKLYRFEKYTGSTEYEYFLKGYTSGKNSVYRYEIGVQLLKKGKTTVSFKVGSKTYKTKITVNAYQNPLKKAEILGKNYAGKLKDQNYYNKIKNTKTKKNQKFSFEANTNWKIGAVSVYEYEKGSYSSSYSRNWNYQSAKSKVTLDVGTLTKNKYYAVELCMKNTKTGGSLWCYYRINYPY